MPFTRREFLSLLALAGAGAACSSGPKVLPPPDTGRTFGEILGTRSPSLHLEIPPFEHLAGTNHHLTTVLLTADPRQGGAPEPIVGAEARLWFALQQQDEAIGPITMRPLEGFNERGIYGSTVNLPTDGTWFALAEIASDTHGLAVALSRHSVGEVSQAPKPGAAMPALKTPTTKASRGVDPICTRTPACSMHALSLDEALANGKPTVMVIGTVAYCTSQFCGPVVEVVNTIAGETPEANFIHLEMLRDDEQATINAYQTGQLPPDYVGSQYAPAVNQLQLLEDPLIYLIDADGTITDLLSGAIDDPAVRQAVTRLV